MGKVHAKDPATGKFRWVQRAEAEAGGMEYREPFGGRHPGRPPKNSEQAAEPPKIPKGPTPKRPKKSGDSIAAIGNLLWLGMSFPVGLFSAPGGRVMQLQIPKAGDHIDRLLQDTRVHELLVGGDSEKGQAALMLFGPPFVAVIGGIVEGMRQQSPDNPRLVMFENMLEQLVRQLLAYQGIAAPQTPPRTAAPRRERAPDERAPEPPPPDIPMPAPRHADNGWAPNDAAAVAQAAAARPPSSINE